MSFPKDLYQYLRANTLTGIRGGPDREKFLDIWMVEVDGRIFARSWGKSARSWFTAIRDTGSGQIKYGDQVIEITGQVVPADSPLTEKINQAYLEKYTQPENVPYAKGISQPEYAEYTMEFLYHE